jgi:hypothetical protein
VDLLEVVQEDHFMTFPLERLRGKKDEAFIGYLSIDLYDPPKEATWGRYNDRIVNQRWVRELVEDFRKNVDNCTNEDALEVAVRREWIQNADDILPTVNDKSIEEVPMMEFTREGKEALQPDNLIMLGGNHRRIALKTYVEEIKEQLEVMKVKLKAKEEAAHKSSDITGPIGQELRQVKEQVEKLEKRLGTSQKWVVRLYDIGEER